MPSILSRLSGAATPPPSEPVEPFTIPDLSEKTDREVIEMTYVKIASAEHMLRALFRSAENNPLLSKFFPTV